ncbi:MAG TPA: DUF488 domain-containing protein [Bryobacteraceae bacterium]
MRLPFYTIGHSTRTIEAFLKLLRAAEVTLIVDIRSVPRSRTNPQYNKDTLPESLAALQVGYAYIAELGGRRGKSNTAQPELNGLWENWSFHNYADYALTPSFRSGMDQLIALGLEQRCTIMCSEAVWWRCHRRIVTDHLIARGERVFHLMDANRVEPARLTEGARIQENGAVIYPAENFED